MQARLLGGWFESQFSIARHNAPPLVVNGVAHPRGLGVHRAGAEKWMLIHLATGHGVVRIDADETDAIVIATEIADCADWTFTSLDGFKNFDPLLPSKMQAIVELYAPCVVVANGVGDFDDPQAASAVREGYGI